MRRIRKNLIVAGGSLFIAFNCLAQAGGAGGGGSAGGGAGGSVGAGSGGSAGGALSSGGGGAGAGSTTFGSGTGTGTGTGIGTGSSNNLGGSITGNTTGTGTTAGDALAGNTTGTITGNTETGGLPPGETTVGSPNLGSDTGDTGRGRFGGEFGSREFGASQGTPGSVGGEVDGGSPLDSAVRPDIGDAPSVGSTTGSRGRFGSLDSTGTDTESRELFRGSRDFGAGGANTIGPEIVSQARGALSRDTTLSSSGRNVAILSQGGVLRLQGSVPTQAEKIKVEELIASTVGANVRLDSSDLRIDPTLAIR